MTSQVIRFQKIIKSHVGGTAVRCERRIHEMKGCPELLHDMVKMGKPQIFTAEADNFHPVIDAVIGGGAE